MFSGGKPGPERTRENAERPDADYMFADVFDDVRGTPFSLSLFSP